MNTSSPQKVVFDLPDAVATRGLGRALADILEPGDMLILTGDLGAGKTTLTQGIGAGLGVQGTIASPTFIVAREHQPGVRSDGRPGPGLVHVDAYRLGGLEELDALDLDTTLEDCVTVVEWGAGLAESLTEDRLEIDMLRPRGAGLDLTQEDPEQGLRQVSIRAVGQRWQSLDWPRWAAGVRQAIATS